MTKEELDQKEREAFLAWRTSLLELEKNEHLLLTPFERNLEMWRQLWRVVERSDLVVTVRFFCRVNNITKFFRLWTLVALSYLDLLI